MGRATKSEQARLDCALDVLAVLTKANETVDALTARAWRRLTLAEIEEIQALKMQLSIIKHLVAGEEKQIAKGLSDRHGAKTNGNPIDGA